MTTQATEKHTPPPTSPLALRIAHDIAEQLKHDGEIWEAWMTDYIEQEAMAELAEALREALPFLKGSAERTKRELGAEWTQADTAHAKAEAALHKAGL